MSYGCNSYGSVSYGGKIRTNYNFISSFFDTISLDSLISKHATLKRLYLETLSLTSLPLKQISKVFTTIFNVTEILFRRLIGKLHIDGVGVETNFLKATHKMWITSITITSFLRKGRFIYFSDTFSITDVMEKWWNVVKKVTIWLASTDVSSVWTAVTKTMTEWTKLR